MHKTGELDPLKEYRVFTGIQLPRTLGERIASAFNFFNPFPDDAKWVNFKTIHFTIHFFNKLSVSQINELINLTKNITVNTLNFRLQLESLGFFPNKKAPRVLWWGIKKLDELMMLQKQLSNSYSQNGFSLEMRDYIPHATLARFKEPIRLRAEDIKKVEEVWALSGEEFFASEIKLYKSPAGPDGYEALETFKLASG